MIFPTTSRQEHPRILTPDQRLRVFVSSTLHELAPERAAARAAIDSLNLTPILFELGARPHPPRELYRSYLEQSQVFVGIYWESYGWLAPGATISGLEDEFILSDGKPQLVYVKEPAPEREQKLTWFLDAMCDEGSASYKHFGTPEELEHLLRDDLAVLLAERFAPAESDLPRGTLTMVFTDIEESTQLVRSLGSEFARALGEHHTLLGDAWSQHGGREVGVEGDACFAVFRSARDAVSAAVDAQRALAAHAWPEDVELRVRMGIHTGEPELGGTNYIGLGVHRAARIAAAAHGGQVLLSETTRQVVEGDEPAGVALLDLGLLRLKDFDEPRHLYQLVVDGLPSEFPAPRTIDERSPRMHALPPQRTTLVGRGRELAEIERLFDEGVRLLTITGPGGIGKTRLAIEAAGLLQHRYADGVAYVPLESVASPQFVVPALAGALGLREPGGDVLSAIVSHLQAKAILLVFDNFKHVTEAAPVVSRLLADLPDLTVLVDEPTLVAPRRRARVAGAAARSGD
jgi:class 3 adenylate cyclase